MIEDRQMGATLAPSKGQEARQMVSYESKVRINRPPEVVFPYLVNARLLRELGRGSRAGRLEAGARANENGLGRSGRRGQAECAWNVTCDAGSVHKFKAGRREGVPNDLWRVVGSRRHRREREARSNTNHCRDTCRTKSHRRGLPIVNRNLKRVQRY
jgi:hypothetical protein